MSPLMVEERNHVLYYTVLQSFLLDDPESDQVGPFRPIPLHGELGFSHEFMMCLFQV